MARLLGLIFSFIIYRRVIGLERNAGNLLYIIN